MDAGVLEEYLRDGLSLERIGELTGRHAPRGGIDKDTLSALVRAGLTTRAIADRLGFSQSSVRHWLRRHGLRTHRARRPDSAGTRGVDPDRKIMTCPRHGERLFWLVSRGIYRCLRCRSEAVARRRRKLKQILVADAGGCCSLCGYDRYIGALQFHHVDGEAKDFGLADRGLTRSLEAVRTEARKCILLCANCHSEVEGGIVKAA